MSKWEVNGRNFKIGLPDTLISIYAVMYVWCVYVCVPS